MGRFQNGWFKAHRTAVFGDIGSNFTRLGMFAKLLGMANLIESTVSWDGKPRILKRGELVTSHRELSLIGEADRKTVARHLEYLVQRKTIETETCHGGTLIRFPNFDKYQVFIEESQAGGHPRDHDRDHPRDHDRDHPRGHEVDRPRDNCGTFEGAYIKELKKPRKNMKSDSGSQARNASFLALAKLYRESITKVRTNKIATGSRARDEFDRQIKSPELCDLLALAIQRYVVELEHDDWRNPKTTFATFLGSKSSGYFWRNYVEDVETEAPDAPEFERDDGQAACQ